MHMHILLLALLAGALVGYVGRVEGRVAALVDRTAMVVLFVILAVMGAKLASPKVLGTLDNIGLSAITFAVFTVAGSLLAVRLAIGKAARPEAGRP